MKTRADTACERCRKQKLRCSRDLPQCARCAKFGLPSCHYPPLPDRKALAQQRKPPKARSIVRQKLDAIPISSSLPGRHLADPISPTPVAAGLRELSPNIRDFLLETYFSCQFHSSLLFHRPTFDKAFAAGHEAQQTLWALYASATIFLPDKSRLYRNNVDLLRSYGDLQLLGKQYALAAGRQTLRTIDHPTFTAVRICEILSLYWFGQGDAQRHAMFLSIAHKAASILGLDRVGYETCFEGEGQTYALLPTWLKGELARRCFWAITFTQCISSDNSAPEIKPRSRLMSIPLPINEQAYLTQQPSATAEPLTIDCVLASESRLNSRDSICAELVIAIYFWAKVRAFLDLRMRTTLPEWLPELYSLDHQMTSWYSQIPEPFEYTKKSLYKQRLQAMPSLFLFVHTVYHQSRLVLHSSLVPQFSGLRLPQASSPEIVDVAARIAIRSAQEISSMAGDLVALDWDPAYLPAFLGYTLYSSATIHIAMLRSTDDEMKRRAKTSLRTNVRWLRHLKQYWQNLDRLWLRINVLYEAHLSRTRSPQDSSVNAEKRGSQDVDALAHEVRDAGTLAEPLADSVLEYSLRHLRPTAPLTSEAVQDLEETVDFEQLDAFIEEYSPSDPHPLLGTEAAFESNTDNSRLTTLSTSTGSLVNPYAAPLPVQDWFEIPDESLTWTDWYGLGPDLLQPMLPYESMLGDFAGAS